MPTSTYSYPAELDTISYHSDAEYQEKIRMLFQMKGKEDEYEEDSAIQALDAIFEKTKQNPLFEKAYILAANKMFLEDPAMGLPILFSYDYLETFHECLVCYWRTPELFQETTPVYQKLIQRLT
jgi:hypothetical protein